MPKEKKLSLFWGLIKTENIDLSKEKFLRRIIILVILLNFIYLVLKLFIN